MSVADFHDIVVRRDAGKAERLFRASVSAYCSLTRPSRREALQLDDLTLPLYDMVSPDARRYVAAALSECVVAPPGLLGRLAGETVDVAAPLLVRSPHIRDAELIALIGRHGLAHARAIARRRVLNPAIRMLIDALENSVAMRPSAALSNHMISRDGPSERAEAASAASDRTGPPAGDAAETIRHKLRAMMRGATAADSLLVQHDKGDATMTFRKLRDAAFTGNETFVATALADALKLNLATARGLLGAGSDSSLVAALRSLDLGEEQAFLIASALLPGHFAHPESIRLFLERYRALDVDTARERVRGWKLEMVANWIQWQSANARGRPAAQAPRHADDAAGRVRAS